MTAFYEIERERKSKVLNLTSFVYFKSNMKNIVNSKWQILLTLTEYTRKEFTLIHFPKAIELLTFQKKEKCNAISCET